MSPTLYLIVMVGLIAVITAVSVPPLFLEKCHKCGRRNVIDSRACRKCGIALADPGSEFVAEQERQVRTRGGDD